MSMQKAEMALGKSTLSIETGRMAKQADGAVLVRLGDTVVLVTACAQREPRPGIDFLPHLIPMTRGILAACHVRTTRPVTQAELDRLYADAYAEQPFVTVTETPPATKHTLGSNEARVWCRLDERTGRVLAIGVLDNLVKGASGQAIQAFNVVHGLPETAGLLQLPIAP